MPTLTQVYLEHPFWVWMALAAALLAIEVATGSGWLLWPSASAAVVAGAAALIAMSLPVAVLAFALLTIATTLLGRRFFPRTLSNPGDDINDNVGRLLGRHGRAIATFEGRCGRVFIDGKEWAADLDEGETMAAGARVEVVEVIGSRLRVKAA